MPKVLPALIARTQFGQLMKRAKENNDRFLVSKKGEPQVVILGIEDYFKNILKKPKSLQRIQAEAKKRGLDKMSMSDIDTIVSDVRKELWGEASK